MGNSSPKPKRKELTVEEKALSQTKVKRILNNEKKFGFQKPEIDAVLAIPITNLHTFLTWEEVSLIIQQNLPNMEEVDCIIMAKAITGGKSLDDHGAR